MTNRFITFPAVVISCAMSCAPTVAAPSPTGSNCVDVQIGDDRTPYLSCLNDQLKKSVERERAAPQPAAPLSATSPPNQIGTFNETSARQTMGNTFGTSPVPQRPPKPVLVSPLLPGVPR
jgi:hypothetical protein